MRLSFAPTRRKTSALPVGRAAVAARPDEEEGRADSRKPAWVVDADGRPSHVPERLIRPSTRREAVFWTIAAPPIDEPMRKIRCAGAAGVGDRGREIEAETTPVLRGRLRAHGSRMR